MKYFTIATVLTLASSALAAIRDVQLFAQSSNEEINNLGLISRREGAGVNYLFLASGAETLKFDDETFTILVNCKQVQLLLDNCWLFLVVLFN